MTRKTPPDTGLVPRTESAAAAAALGGPNARPEHALTADRDIAAADWERIAALDEFKALLAAKRRFIVPAVLFFITYYFALPVLVGYAPEWMAVKVLGVVNVAYLFALSQFFMAWTIALLYVRAANRFDSMTSALLARFRASRR